tara:strand:+ start:10443 stop:10964 length:522 start_codon:yes stop_codon:yes gene_type:complete
MKKLIFLIFFICINPAIAKTNIAYLDVQYIIDKSELGIYYKNKLNLIKNKSKSELIEKEQKIKEFQTEIKNKSNILKKDEIDSKVVELNKIVNKYKSDRKILNKKFTDEKNKYTSKILELLNPLLTEYVEKNNIHLVIEKKNVLIGMKTLDITNQILLIFDEEIKKNKFINEN